MKVLCIRQPWAELIARGEKTIELRTWRTSYRGPILIASSLARGAQCFRWDDVDGPRGHAVAVVELVDVRPAAEEDWQEACCVPEPGEFAWVVERARRVEPFPVSGRLGLFPPPPQVLKKLRKALKLPRNA